MSPYLVESSCSRKIHFLTSSKSNEHYKPIVIAFKFMPTPSQYIFKCLCFVTKSSELETYRDEVTLIIMKHRILLILPKCKLTTTFF